MTATKRRTNLTLDESLLQSARAHGLNISAIAEEALGQAVRRAEAEAWARDNADALVERRAHVDRQGLALDRHRLWQAE